MLFNESEIQKILGNVDYMVARMVAKVLGKEFLTKEDLTILKKRGVDLVKLLPKFPSHYQAFLFGRISAAVGPKLSSQMSYSDFTKFLANMGLFEPKTSEMEFYKVAAQKTYTHIKGLGDRIKNDVRASISAEELNYLAAQKAAETEEIIHKEILDGTFERRSIKKITSNIAEQANDWNRDWGRIVETESQDVFNLGRAQFMLQNDSDPSVYFDVYPGACRHCIRLYLTHGIGSQPRVFRLQELLANGTNYGVKSKDWKATVHPVHPFCFNSPATKIFTVEGWKNISDIKCGDLVLTHNNRFKKVLKTYKREVSGDEEIYNVEFEVLTRYGKRTTKVLKKITGNHPVLLNGSWKEICYSKVGDELEIKGVECERCGKLIQLLPKKGENLELCGFCTNSLSAEEQFRKYPWIKEYNSKCASKQMRERYKFMSKKDRQNLTLNARKKVRENHPEGYQWLLESRSKANSTNGKGQTFIEKKLGFFLKRLGVEYETGKFIPNNGKFENNVRGYFPDIFIPEFNIILEADGDKWHKNKKEYDATRDCDLKREYGYDTFRFSEKEIRECGEKVYEKLKLLFKNHSGNFHGIKAKITKIEKCKPFSKYLYNFSVEEDESYIADGVVVHNCRCDLRELPRGYVWNDETHQFEPPKNYERKVERKSRAKITIGDKEYQI
jgi:hypothetical protein